LTLLLTLLALLTSFAVNTPGISAHTHEHTDVDRQNTLLALLTSFAVNIPGISAHTHVHTPMLLVMAD